MKKTIDRNYQNNTLVDIDEKELKADIEVEGMNGLLHLDEDEIHCDMTPTMYMARKEHQLHQEQFKKVFNELNDRRCVATTEGDKFATGHNRNDDYITSKKVVNYCTQLKHPMEESIIRRKFNESAETKPFEKDDAYYKLLDKYFESKFGQQYADLYAKGDVPNAKTLFVDYAIPEHIEIAQKMYDKVLNDEIQSVKKSMDIFDLRKKYNRLSPEKQQQNSFDKYVDDYAKKLSIKSLAEKGISDFEYFYTEPTQDELEAAFKNSLTNRQKYPDELESPEYDISFNTFYDYIIDLLYGPSAGTANSNKDEIYKILGRNSVPYVYQDERSSVSGNRTNYSMKTKYPNIVVKIFKGKDDLDERRILDICELFNFEVTHKDVTEMGESVAYYTIDMPKEVADMPKSVFMNVWKSTNKFTAQTADIEYRFSTYSKYSQKQVEDFFVACIVDVADYYIMSKPENEKVFDDKNPKKEIGRKIQIEK